jgi:hypothetical protein
MAIEYLGKRAHDPFRSRVCFEACIDGEILDCSIDDRFRQTLGDEYGDALECFDACHMFILDCAWATMRGAQNILSELISFDEAQSLANDFKDNAEGGEFRRTSAAADPSRAVEA